MNTASIQKLSKDIRILLTVFIIGLIVSGITAFPIETELQILVQYKALLPLIMQSWLISIHQAVALTNKHTLT
jgi:hypothetical protein